MEEGKEEEGEKEREKGKKLLAKDPLEPLLQYFLEAIEDIWADSWADPEADIYRLFDYANFTSIATSFLNLLYLKSEGFTISKEREKPTILEIGISSSTYGGVEGLVNESLSIETVGDTIPRTKIKKELSSVLERMLKSAQEKGLQIFKEYAKKPQEKVPQIYEKGKAEKAEKYFLFGLNPSEFEKQLKTSLKNMYDLWAKRLGLDVIKDATANLNYKKEFDLLITKTKHGCMEGTQKEIRLRLETMIDVKDVGEITEAIGSSGGIDSFQFTHPVTLEKYTGWEAIEALGDWTGTKAQMMQRAEKPEDIFKDKKINIIIPSTIFGAAISHFFSGKKMWESIKDEKKYQLYKLVGQKVMPSDFTMLLDGRQTTAWGTDLYGSLEIDAECTLPEEKVIIEDGKLKRFYNSRVYFLPIAERTALAKELLAEEQPLVCTARKESARGVFDTVPTNLYIKPGSYSLDELVDKLGKEKIHLFVVSSSLAAVDIEKGTIKIKVDLGQPIQAGKINRDISIKKLAFTIPFSALSEKIKYLGDQQTIVSHAFNFETEGKTYEISVTGPYLALFDIEYEKIYTTEAEDIKENLFTSQHFYSRALPQYIGKKLQTKILPESLKNFCIVYQPLEPRAYDEWSKKVLPARELREKIERKIEELKAS